MANGRIPRAGWSMSPELIVLIVFLAVVAVLSVAARAHEAPSGMRYGWDCCSDKDCAPLPEGAVRIVPGGYSVEGDFFAHNDARIHPSTDGAYHGCRYHPDVAEMLKSRFRCLYVPPVGS